MTTTTTPATIPGPTDDPSDDWNDEWDSPEARMKRGWTRAGTPRKRCQCSCGRFIGCENPSHPGHDRYPCLECYASALDHYYA